MPFLSNVSVSPPTEVEYLSKIASLKDGAEFRLTENVTFFVGENGSGKSTLLEAIAEHCGFSLMGGNKNHNLAPKTDVNGYQSALSRYLKLSWTPRKITQGFFLRAESFYNFASQIDEIAVDDPDFLDAYGGKSLHEQSHGESFLALFNNQFNSGIYILDEPEASLSPARILALISVINNLEQSGKSQFLIATHSPMLMCYPNAAIYQFDNNGVNLTPYEATEHFQLTKAFLNSPSTFFHHLLGD